MTCSSMILMFNKVQFSLTPQFCIVCELNDVVNPTHDVTLPAVSCCAEVSNHLYLESFGFDYCNSLMSIRELTCVCMRI